MNIMISYPVVPVQFKQIQKLRQNLRKPLPLNVSVHSYAIRGERGRAVKALDSGAQGSGFWVRHQLVSAGSLSPWIRHFTQIAPWFEGHVKPSVPSEVLSTHFRM